MIKDILRILRNALFPVRVKGRDNTVSIRSKIRKGFRIVLNGNNNEISIGEDCLLSNTCIEMIGDNNHLIVYGKVRFLGPCRIRISGGANLIIRENAGIRGVNFELNGAKIDVGELCMFSYGITLRNHDSHKVIDPKNGQILNAPKDIVLDRHVWIAQNVTILKGCHIGQNSILGFGAIVTNSCPPGSIMVGTPAKVVKENINWDY